MHSVGLRFALYVVTKYRLHISDFTNMEEFVAKYMELVFEAWKRIFVIPISPSTTEWNGQRIADPDEVGIPFSQIISQSGATLMMPNVVNLLADACRRQRTTTARVYRLASTEHPITDHIRDEYLNDSLSGAYQLQIDPMQRDANCDMTNDEIKGR